ncbi:MAG: UDP-N-acetylglucosamine 2-epimerase (non-hydrolyzing) [Thermodesulfobacteriota bacterium]|nr:UDP-N-acetylglucosamine 2-epimerase (non-hydrolyzing) [Thermodesulfobacteriota bacterium]
MILHIVGARPQFIKLFPVSMALERRGIPFRVLHTGQHYDHVMSGLHFNDLGLRPPEYSLNIGSASHAIQTARMLEGIEKVILEERPALTIVYGDTNSTLAGALASAKLHIPVAHVEAGLRSFDRKMPEEINRVVCDHVSTWHFCPTQNAVDLLAKEGIEGIFTGDVMLDAIHHFAGMIKGPVDDSQYILTTIHRAENTDSAMRFHSIWEALKEISRTNPIIFPIHPRTKAAFGDIIDHDHPGIKIIEPAGYLDMLSLIQHAACVMTDSGGIQKEAFFLKTQCVTLRDTTEWPETIDARANILAGAETSTILSCLEKMMHARMDERITPFGDKRAGEHIVDVIEKNMGATL